MPLRSSLPALARPFSSSPSAHKALPFFLSTAPPPAQSGRGPPKVLRMLMFGKPGAGKGTLSARLVNKYDITALSTGDLLRMHIAERTEVGREAEEIVAQGGLLPDKVVLKVVTSKLDQMHNKHWILDGFPRTLGQGELLDSHLKKQNTPLTLVVNLDVPDKVILSRITDRWIHLPSGRVYNMSYNRPRVEGFDDITGEPLTKRPDDNPVTFARRLSQFYTSTAPLLQHYARLASRSSSVLTPASHKLQLTSLTGSTSDEIWPQLEGVLRRSFPTLKERVETRELRRRHSLSDAVMGTGPRVQTSNAAGVGKGDE